MSSTTNSTDLWQVNFDYGTTDNNGNVKGQQIIVPTGFTAIQNYTYDSEVVSKVVEMEKR
jgi:hypothetical protein